MKRKSILWVAGLLTWFFTSCGDFLNEYSQNLSYVESPDDLAELLLGSGYQDPAMTTVPGAALASFFNNTMNKDFMLQLYLLDDDIKEAPAPAYGYTTGKAWQLGSGYYRWADDPLQTITTTNITDPMWEDFYKRIAVLNSIISEIDNLRDKCDAQELQTLEQVSGETYFLRAWYYFMLVNFYGAPYDKSNPNYEWGVPLKLTEEVQDLKYTRSTVGQVYESIVSDLQRGIEHFQKLESPGVNKRIASEDACWAMLSRVYLYMERYEDCIAAANELEGYNITNLATLDITESFATIESGETIFSHGPYALYYVFGDDAQLETYTKPDIQGWIESGMQGDIPTIKVTTAKANGWSYACSDEFTALFEEEGVNDYRYNRFFSKTRYQMNLVPRKWKGKTNFAEYDPVSMDTIVFAGSGTPAASGGWLRYGEVLLNKAEAQACLNQAEAATTIRTLLERRYKVLPTIPSGGKELVDFIRLERRKELCYEGHRWFDLRRYSVNQAYPSKKALTHDCYQLVITDPENPTAEQVGHAFLEEYGENSLGCWMIPIPDDVIEFCDGSMKNAERNGSSTDFVIEETEEEE